MALAAPSVPFVADGLSRVEAALREAVRVDDAYLTDIASHLISAGGKRQRPAFCLAASLTQSPEGTLPSQEAVLGGVAVELVHLGSLYHDDVMDDATTRRTVESVNARWGNLQAILAGDFLLAKASEIAAGLGTEVAGLLANTIGRLCEGQVAELRDTYNPARTEERYFTSIAGKTAALFATSCRIGGIVAGLDRPSIDALTAFGQAYGLAFQIVDDVLDVVATEEELGKPTGNDLVEGVYTLPVLRTLATDPSGELEALLGRVLDPAEREKARSIVRADGAVAASVVEARRHADAAIEALGPAAGTEAGQWLAATAHALVDKVDGRT